MAEGGFSDGSRVDVNCKGTLADQSSVSSAGVSQKKKRKTVVRKESAETQDYVSCQDTEVDDDKSLEDVGFVPSAVSDSGGWRKPIRVKHMCDKKCNEEGFKFMILQPSWWQKMTRRTRSTSPGTVVIAG